MVNRRTITDNSDPDAAKGADAAAPKPPPARWPRLLDDRAAAEYLGLSRWTIRDYIARGLLEPVDLPPIAAREGERQRDTLRRVLIDLENLNAFVDSRKRGNR